MADQYLEHDWFSRPLPANVQLGERSWLHSSYALLHYRSRAVVGLSVGHDTGIYCGSYFELGPQGQVKIGDYCSIVGAIVATNRQVEIGSYTLIAHEVVLADHAHGIPAGPTDVAPGDNDTAPERGICIGENVWIGTRAVVLGNVTIGEGAIIGAATVVQEDVPPYAIYAGNPGRIVGDARTRTATAERPQTK